MPNYRAVDAVDTARAIFGGMVDVLKPRFRGEVWEWAENKPLVLSSRVTPFPGPIRFSRTPYMIGEWSPLWAYKRYEFIDWIAGAQVAKTTALQVTIGYDSEVDPGPGLIVYPDQDIGKKRSDEYIRPFLEDSMKNVLTGNPDDLQLFKYRLQTMTWLIGWAGSASSVASFPIKHLKLDEEGKFTRRASTEADAKRNAEERMTAFRPFAQCLGVTTPSEKDLPGWRDWANYSTRCQHYAVCPLCGHRQVLYFRHDIDRKWFVEDGGEWRGGIKWSRDEGLSKDERIETAYYECEACAGHWNDQMKNDAVAAGAWEPKYADAKRYTAHTPQWYARWVRLSHVVAKWFDAYKDDDGRRRFLNSGAAVPYEPDGRKVEISTLRKCQTGHRAGTVHPETVAVFLTVDVHDDHLRYRIRGWTPTFTTWGIEEGRLLPGMEEVDRLIGKTWKTPWGVIGIDRGIIDARWRTDEVYQACLRHPDVLYPVMGQGVTHELFKFARQYVAADPGNDLPLEGWVTRIDINDDRWKDLLHNRWLVPMYQDGAWHVEDQVSDNYFYELTGEVKKDVVKRNGRTVKEWVQVHDNHMLDCEKYQLLAAHVFKISALPPRDMTAAQEDQGQVQAVVNPYTGREVGSR